jgi:hypothetical protein
MGLFGNNKKDSGEYSSSPVVSDKTKSSASFLKKTVSKIGSIFKSKKFDDELTAEPMSNTEYLGEIYKLMVQNHDDIKLERQQTNNRKEEENSEDQKRHSEIIKALTLRRRPKPKRVVRRERKAEEKAAPTAPSMPGKPGKKPGKPSAPSKPSQPPSKPAETKPPQPSQPPSKPAEPSKPPSKPAEPSKPPSKPAEPSKPAQPAQKPAETKPVQPSKPAEPVKPAETKPVQKPAETKPAQKPPETKPAEPAKPAQKPAETKPAEPKKTAEPVKETPKQTPTKPAEPVKPPEAPKPPTPAPKPAPPKPSAIPIGSNAGKIAVISALVAAGYSKAAQANILANVKEESDFVPQTEKIGRYTGKNLMSLYGGPQGKNADGTLKQTKNGTPLNQAGNKIRFNTIEDANNLVKQGPDAVAEVIYGGRMGNDKPGDGAKYVGRGYIQLTGKDAYKAISKMMFNDDRLVKNPELANDPKIAADMIPVFMKWKKYSVTDLENVDKSIQAIGSANEKSRQERKKLAAEYNTKGFGDDIDSASKNNKDMKSQNPAPPPIVQQNTTNVNNTTGSTSSPAVNDRPKHDRK